MKLFILFAKPSDSAPVAMTVVDELTIRLSGRKEDEYKELALLATKDQCEDEMEHWGWFETTLPDDGRAAIQQFFNEEPPTFSASMSASPVAQQHPSYEGIKVTVGRTPGRLPHDEDNNF